MSDSVDLKLLIDEEQQTSNDDLTKENSTSGQSSSDQEREANISSPESIKKSKQHSKCKLSQLLRHRSL